MSGRIAGALLLVFAVGTLCRADDKPIERLDIDKRVVNAVYEVALKGTDIFNKGKHEECFGLYQGLLIGLQPLLDHRPNLQKSVKEKMDKARGLKPAEGAFVLRDALDEIQNEIAPTPKTGPKIEPKIEPKVEPKVEPKTEPKKATLWERLGGESKVRPIVKDFIKAASEDKKVNFFRDGKVKLDAKAQARMEQLFVELISLFASGPLPYSEKRTLLEAHMGMKITDAEFDAILAVLQKTLEDHKVVKEESEELMKHFAATRRLIVEVKRKGM
jgi:hemoglobin